MRKLNAKLRAASYEAIGLYVYLYDYAKNLDSYQIHSEAILVTGFINSLKKCENIDRLLVELESTGLIIYERFTVTLNELAPRDVREHSLDAELGGVWLEWVNYKAREKKSGYKSPESERRAFTQLIKEVNNDSTLAANVLLNAMAMAWHGPNTDVYLKRLTNQKKYNENRPTEKLGRIDSGQLTDWINS